MKVWRYATIVCLSASLVVTSVGCMKGNFGAKGSTQDGKILPFGNGMKGLGDGVEVLPVVTQNGISYVDASQLVNKLDMKSEWDAASGTFSFGDQDATYSMKVDKLEALMEGEDVQLAEPPVLINNVVHLPISALNSLLAGEMTYRLDGTNLRLHQDGKPDIHLLQNEDANVPMSNDLDFADDPNDPYKNIVISQSPNVKPSAVDADDSQTAEPVVALRDIDIPALMSRAQQYLGVPYKFGASSYAATGAFDCSLYTQYVFGKFGIDLPRLARQQSRVGVLVSRKNIRVGDLLFFYIPGRFKTNTIAGHVGIYMGNGKMINATTKPQNGVQISDINKPFWKRTFLSARRVAY